MAAYIRFAGVDGDSTQYGRAGWSDLSYFEFTSARKTSLRPAASRRSSPKFHLKVHKSFDGSSLKLFASLCEGHRLPDADIQVVCNGPHGREVAYFAYHLEGVEISCYIVSHDGFGRPVELLELRFAKVYMMYASDETIGCGYDVKKRKLLPFKP